MRQWRRRKKALGVFSKYAKRCKSVNISENNNMNKIFLLILTNYTIWDGLRQKNHLTLLSLSHIFLGTDRFASLDSQFNINFLRFALKIIFSLSNVFASLQIFFLLLNGFTLLHQ
jgi:hypothetical protein